MSKTKPFILVTGGMGFIGSHTIVELIENHFDVISIDNFSNSRKTIIKGIEKVCKRKIVNINMDLCDYTKIRESLKKLNKKIDGIIHFAAYKAVGESVQLPLKYYHNNLTGTINILKICQEFKIQQLVFSSSCTVYGNPKKIPVTEETPLQPAESPYGATKQMNEIMIRDFAKSQNHTKCVLLRYFNPAGAHKSFEIGELPLQKPQNLVPVITQTAIGKIKQLQVFGDDYSTPDGSCIRDYIHVTDLANAHVKALEYIDSGKMKTSIDVFNIGTGKGSSVKEMIGVFLKKCYPKLNYQITRRRQGDIEKIYANNKKAIHVLGWKPKYGIEEILYSAWEWERKINK